MTKTTRASTRSADSRPAARYDERDEEREADRWRIDWSALRPRSAPVTRRRALTTV